MYRNNCQRCVGPYHTDTDTVAGTVADTDTVADADTGTDPAAANVAIYGILKT